LSLRQKFLTLYEANFGPFPAEDPKQAAVWRKFLDRLRPEQVEPLVAVVVDARVDARGKPRLEDFRRAYSAITGETEQRERPGGCGFCGGVGTFAAAWSRVSSQASWQLGIGPGHCRVYRLPCLCPKGEAMAKGSGEDKRIRAREWRKSVIAELQKRGEPCSPFAVDNHLEKQVRKHNQKSISTPPRRAPLPAREEGDPVAFGELDEESVFNADEEPKDAPF